MTEDTVRGVQFAANNRDFYGKLLVLYVVQGRAENLETHVGSSATQHICKFLPSFQKFLLW